jgi:hypothetical protein
MTYSMLHASAWRKAPGALRFIAFSWAIGYGKRADLARWMRPKSAHLNPPASL